MPNVQRLRCFWRFVVVVSLLLALLGCGSRQQGLSSSRPGDTDYLVRKIQIEGADSVPIELLRQAIATKVLSLNPFGENRFLNRYDLMTDLQRIETFYRMKGYFDARVVGPAEVTLDEEVRRASIKWTVVEGEPSILTEIRVLDAAADVTSDSVASREQAALFERVVKGVMRRLPMRTGQVYDYDKMISTGVLLRRRVQEQGYARATVESRAYVSEAERKVIVVFRVTLGQQNAFGDVIVEGNSRIPTSLIREAAALQRGRNFRPSLLERARSRLYGLNAFQIVDVSAGLEGEIGDDESLAPNTDRFTLGVLSRELPVVEDESGELVVEAPEGWRAVDDEWLFSTETLDAVAKNSPWSRDWLDLHYTPGWSFDATSTDMMQEGYMPTLMASFTHEGLDTRVAQLPIDFSQLQIQNPDIDVRIRVVELPAAGYRFGVGGEIDSGRWVAFLRANAIWRDVFAPLNTFEADLRLGYAWLPTPFFRGLDALDVSNRGVIARASLKYSRPGLIANVWNFHTALTMEKNVELIYDLIRFGGDVGIDRRWGYRYRLELSYNIDFNREISSLDDSRDVYRVAWLGAAFTADFRDKPLQPRRGFYGELLTEVGDPWGGQFAFLQINPDLRGYFPISRRLTLAVRGSFGWIFNFPSDERLPANHRLYEGGASSFRGAPYRRLSPHQFRIQDNDPATPDREIYGSSAGCEAALGDLISQNPGVGYACRAEPIGGVFSSVLSIEPRYEIGRDWLFGALFLDAGTVQTEVLPKFQLDENYWHLALGAGLRIATPLGPVRLDLAYRFTTADAFHNVNRLVFFLAIGEAF